MTLWNRDVDYDIDDEALVVGGIDNIDEEDYNNTMDFADETNPSDS